MRSGYFIYKDERYSFELDDEYITIVNENGMDWKKFLDNFNKEYKGANSVQILNVKLFPNWNDAIILHNHNLDSIGEVSTFKIQGIIEFKNEKQNVDALKIYSKELEHIYDSRKILESIKYNKTGEMDLKIKASEKVNSEKKQIKLKNEIIGYYFGIERKVKNINEGYFSGDSFLRFEWNSLVEDYKLVYEIVMTGYYFLSYLCYRQNINLKRIELLKKDENGKYFSVAQMTLFIHNMSDAEDEYIRGYQINFDYVKTIDDKILQAIIDENIFIRNIPENELERNKITPQSFVLVSSAFEWEFNQLFPNGVEHSKVQLNEIEEIKNDLMQLSDNYDKTKKKAIKKIIENIGKDNLESKIIYANKKLGYMSEMFLKHLCDLNSINNKNRIFTCLQKLRNDFAHGNMDIDIDSDGFVGIIYLERLIYIMQLKRLGLDDDNIIKAINGLFCNRYYKVTRGSKEI